VNQWSVNTVLLERMNFSKLTRPLQEYTKWSRQKKSLTPSSWIISARSATT